MDAKEFLASGYQYVWELLAEEGEFPPFFRALNRDGTVSTVIAEDGLVSTLEREIAIRSPTIEAVALFTMAHVENDGQPAQPVIMVHIDVRNGPNRLALTPYVLEGGLQIGQLSYQVASERLLHTHVGT